MVLEIKPAVASLHFSLPEEPDFQFLLYGQAAALGRELPAAALMKSLVEEAQSLLGAK